MTPSPVANAILVVGGLAFLTWFLHRFGDLTPTTPPTTTPKPKRRMFNFGRRRKFVGYRCSNHALTGIKPGNICLLDAERCTVCRQNQSTIDIKK